MLEELNNGRRMTEDGGRRTNNHYSNGSTLSAMIITNTK
jgi:hypothetical protein